MNKTGASILVVEDDDHTRDYLVATLEADEHVHRVDGARTLREGSTRLAESPPDVMLVDLGLPDGSGLDLIRQAREQSPETRSMVITIFADERSTIRAIEAGACGYLLKSDVPEDLRRAVAQLLDGGAPISPAIASHLLRRFGASPSSPPADPKGPRLTTRETEVLQLIVRGRSYREVAEALGITRHTATTHIRNIYGKLAVKSRSEAVYEAISRGIVKVRERD